MSINISDYMSTFGVRIKEERKRIGMNQTDFAAAGGVQKRAQVSYEQDERTPNIEYLALLSKIGVDVVYLLTGDLGAAALAEREKLLVTGFRALDERGQAGVLALVGGMAPAESKAKAVFHGTVGQVIKGDITSPQTFNFGVSESKKK